MSTSSAAAIARLHAMLAAAASSNNPGGNPAKNMSDDSPTMKKRRKANDGRATVPDSGGGGLFSSSLDNFSGRSGDGTSPTASSTCDGENLTQKMDTILQMMIRMEERQQATVSNLSRMGESAIVSSLKSRCKRLESKCSVLENMLGDMRESQRRRGRSMSTSSSSSGSSRSSYSSSSSGSSRSSRSSSSYSSSSFSSSSYSSNSQRGRSRRMRDRGRRGRSYSSSSSGSSGSSSMQSEYNNMLVKNLSWKYSTPVHSAEYWDTNTVVLDDNPTMTIRVCQGGNVFLCKVNPETRTQKLIDANAERIGIDGRNLRLLVHGERLAENGTIASLGLEDNDCIDCFLAQGTPKGVIHTRSCACRIAFLLKNVGAQRIPNTDVTLPR